MNSILTNSNKDLLREIETTKDLVNSKEVPSELIPYKQWLIVFLEGIEADVKQNLYLLSLNDSDIVTEVFNNTTEITRYIRLINSRFFPPLYRHNVNDVIALKVLNWLHKQHQQTEAKAFIITDGNFGVFPEKQLPLTYFLPTSSQHSLLNFPLFFHEIGHFFYEYHRQEMDDLVSEFQKKIEELLRLPYYQNDEKFRSEMEKSMLIIETWYEWIQEFFCDAVGLTIGGASYLNAFSYYLKLGGRNSFFIPEKELAKRSHPVSWLRIKFLSQRARTLGLVTEANELELEWKAISVLLNIKEEYFGYYSEQYEAIVNETLECMLTEAAPIKFSDFDMGTQKIDLDNFNYIHLLNVAWVKFKENQDSYYKWEKSILEALKK